MGDSAGGVRRTPTTAASGGTLPALPLTCGCSKGGQSAAGEQGLTGEQG